MNSLYIILLCFVAAAAAGKSSRKLNHSPQESREELLLDLYIDKFKSLKTFFSQDEIDVSPDEVRPNLRFAANSYTSLEGQLLEWCLSPSVGGAIVDTVKTQLAQINNYLDALPSVPAKAKIYDFRAVITSYNGIVQLTEVEGQPPQHLNNHVWELIKQLPIGPIPAKNTTKLNFADSLLKANKIITESLHSINTSRNVNTLNITPAIYNKCETIHYILLPHNPGQPLATSYATRQSTNPEVRSTHTTTVSGERSQLTATQDTNYQKTHSTQPPNVSGTRNGNKGAYYTRHATSTPPPNDIGRRFPYETTPATDFSVTRICQSDANLIQANLANNDLRILYNGPQHVVSALNTQVGANINLQESITRVENIIKYRFLTPGKENWSSAQYVQFTLCLNENNTHLTFKMIPYSQ
ncbi:uncharacterized protein LOC108605318 [Drosophila busckii]|uniref:uncharacterized protein LOC108605318 n=1 Tax=Drosophila busckii TaxID=30019 RepID=UPI00083F3F24|nr:uncharacterized protein LOC108605318 [Drosophila busckii]